MAFGRAAENADNSQSVGMELPVEAPAHLTQHVKKTRLITVIEEDRLSPVSARSHMIEGTGKLDS
jgi:hypothetical protein